MVRSGLASTTGTDACASLCLIGHIKWHSGHKALRVALCSEHSNQNHFFLIIQQ